MRYLDIIPSPAGSLFSSVHDMAHYIAALCDGGRGVIPPRLLDEMMRPQFSIDARLPAMGLAFFLGDIDGHRVVSHDGGVNGFVSYLKVAPDDGVGVVVFTNSNTFKISMAIDGFGDDVLRAALGTRGAAGRARPVARRRSYGRSSAAATASDGGSTPTFGPGCSSAARSRSSHSTTIWRCDASQARCASPPGCTPSTRPTPGGSRGISDRCRSTWRSRTARCTSVHR